jgi:integrase
VSGTKRDGTRIRENHPDRDSAEARHAELLAEYKSQPTELHLRRATWLNEEQLRIAESAFTLIPDPNTLLRAVTTWKAQGAAAHVATSPTADEAFAAFEKWLDGAPDESGNNICDLRPLSRRSLRNRTRPFVNQLGMIKLCDVTPEQIEGYLGKLDVSQTSKSNDKRAISRFFSWCAIRPRKWIVRNPASEVNIEKEKRGEPEILTVEQSEKLLRAAEKNGMAAYIAVSLFAGLRPFEVKRLSWDNVNLSDREIRVTAESAKTGKGRTVAINDTLAAWLERYKGQSFQVVNFDAKFPALKKAAGITTETKDTMRHTAISFYFRQCGSYGLTAEQHGNSEKIVREHYQGRVSTEQTKQFYGLFPSPNTK